MKGISYLDGAAERVDKLFDGLHPPLITGIVTECNTKTVIDREKVVPHLGEVAQGIWLERSFAGPERAEYVPYDRRAGDPAAIVLFSVTPKGKSMNLRFRDPGVRLICHRTPFAVMAYQSGDLVIVERQAHDLCEMTCKRVDIDGEGVFWLRSESDDPAFSEPWRIGAAGDGSDQDVNIQIIAKVLRGEIDYGRN